MVHDEVTVILDKMDLARKSDIREQVAAALRDAGLAGAASPEAAAGSDQPET
jgi:hypothetical protein